MLFFCGSRKTNPYCAQMRSKGSLRRLVGRNLRFNRADPPLHYGQPSPLRCALLSPQGLATLQGPQKPARWSAKGEPPPLSCPCRSKVALLRFLARIAPVAPQGIVAVSATGGAPIPCPSEEGNYAASGLTLADWLPSYAHSSWHLPSAEVRQAGSWTGTPSPASGEGRGRGQMRPRHPISTV